MYSNCEMLTYPIRRFCDFCWTLRPDWVTSPSGQRNRAAAASCQDSGFLSPGLTEGHSPSPGLTEDHSPSDCIQVNSGRLTGNDTTNVAVEPGESRTDGQPSVGLCMICLSAPKDASLVHGKTGHQACCFQCARRLKSRGRPCPVCRRPINRVIRNFIV